MRFSSLFRTAIAASLFTISLHAAAFAQAMSPLEQLFVDKNAQAFHAQALKQAAAGSAEANFLLGKAYHLGMGVDKDLALADKWYRAAAKLGSARATHNLGQIALDAKDRDTAIALLNKALAMGMEMPTLFNLGHAYTPEAPEYAGDIPSTIDNARKAASYFEQAYALNQGMDAESLAGREYFRVWDFTRILRQRGRADQADVAAARVKAVEWLTIAMNKGSTGATVNLGTLLMEERNYTEAGALFARAAAAGHAAAHYQLGELANRTTGKDAIGHFEAAARLNFMPAMEVVLDHHRSLVDFDDENDAVKMRTAADRLEAVNPTMFAEQVRQWRASAEFQEERDASHAQAAALPRLPIRLDACRLDRHPIIRRALPSESQWTLMVMRRGGQFHERLPITGPIRNGCAQMQRALPANVRRMVAGGAYLALEIGHYTMPFDMVISATEIRLTLRAAKPGADE